MNEAGLWGFLQMFSFSGSFRLVFAMVFFFVAAVSVSGCATLGGNKDDAEALMNAADKFNKDLRWEEYKAASHWVAPATKMAFWNCVDKVQGQMRIMEYDIRDAYLEDKRSGVVIVRYRLYFKNNPQLQVKTLRQEWVFSDKERSWTVDGTVLEKIVQGPY